MVDVGIVESSSVRIEDIGVEKVVVTTVAKVASASFLYSLTENGFDVHHGHDLHYLREVVTSKRNHLVVSGIRNPLDRNVSYFFQTYKDDFFNDFRTAKNAYRGEYCFLMTEDELLNENPLHLIDRFLKQPHHFTFNDWFYEFFSITNIDSIEFDKDAGIQLFSLPNENYLLFYTFEKLTQNKPFIEAFFGLNELKHSNNPESRPYNEKYKEFKSLLAFETDYKSKLLNTPIMNNFYDKTAINEFFNKY